MGTKERKLKDDFTWLWKTIRSQYWTYFILLLALLGCLYTMNSATDAYDKCNVHWIEQIQDNGCSCSGFPSQDSYYVDQFGYNIPTHTANYIESYNGS
jgi:hypothetical protein